jgi:hypothetical protein
MKQRVPPPNPEYLKFLSPFENGIKELALATRALVFVDAPDLTELIYDAYNAVATGYSFTGRPSDAFIHIAVYAHWVNLGFNRGSELEDPQGMLQGSGALDPSHQDRAGAGFGKAHGASVREGCSSSRCASRSAGGKGTWDK